MSYHDPAVARIEAALAWLRRWTLRLLLALLVLAVVAYLVSSAVTLETDHLWFESLHDGSVYSTILGARVLLFVGFAVLAGAASAASVAVVRRHRPRRRADEQTQKWRWRFQHAERRTYRLLLVGATLIPAVLIGLRAGSAWQTYLLWRHAQPWGVTDPQFHRDISYFVDVWPFHVLVVGLLRSAVVWAAVATVVTAYLYGGLRLRGKGPGITKPVKAQLSVLGAAYLVLTAASLWLGRYAVSTSHHGSVTGPSWTDVHTALPGAIALMVLALLTAALLVANVFLRRLRLLVGGVALMLVASLLVGTAWPWLTSRLREQPSAATLELPFIARNQQATLDAFGLAGRVTTQKYGAATSQEAALHGSALQAKAGTTAQIRLLDPARLSPTFNVKQQLQAYYGFKTTLDIDRYPLDGTSRDVAIAVRELSLSGVSRPTWANNHLVYTHGYGVVAAPTDALDSTTEVPEFLDGGMPPGQQIPVTQPDVYFGQNSPSYSIVGRPSGSTQNLEFDHPATDGTAAVHTTYDGGGGVAVGSLGRRLLYAIREHSLNILFSKQVNSGSRILTVRDPRARVAQVAPWLTLDGDVYPAVVDGTIQWVVDGYTSTSNYPESQEVNLRQATASTLSQSGSVVRQPGRSVNYLRNSVKATVDAYTGAVTLYEWDQDALPDPLLETWEAAFPGLVKPQSDMPADLLEHLRYPQDLFDVQRQLLTQYHVTDPADFYSGNDFWAVPTDPTVAATQQLNSTGQATTKASPPQPSVYMSLAPDGMGAPVFSLSSPLVTLNRRNLAGFLSVDATPGPDYGRFTLLEFPAGTSAKSPAQVQNDIESSTKISEALTLQRGGNSKVVLGNLLSIPLAGRMLSIEPVYTQATGGNSFPILRHVIAIYGDGEPAFTTDLPEALRQAVASGDRP